MSHEFESGLFVGEPAWHRLGVVLENPPTPAEAIKAAGLDWRVDLVPLQAAYEGQLLKTDAFAAVRSSDASVLGTVGPDYHVVQNSEAFDWFQPFIDAGCTIEAAGSLRHGRRVWVLARTPQGLSEVVPNDAVSQYILLAHGHDGTLRVSGGLTDVRVVCQNTLSAALGAKGLFRFKHTKSVKDKLAQAQESVAAINAQFLDNVRKYKALAAAQCNKETFVAYMKDLFDCDEFDMPRVVKRVAELQETGRGMQLPGVQGTMWGAYNAMTEFLTHERGRTDDARLESQWFGDSAELTNKALASALKFAA